MQRFAAKAGIGAAVLAIAAVAFLAGSAIEDGNAAVIQQETGVSARGIEWVNFSTGGDYNARERDAEGKHREYFAEIHLLIKLGNNPSVVQKVNQAAENDNLPELRRLLRERLDTNWSGYHADTAIINHLMLRPSP